MRRTSSLAFAMVLVGCFNPGETDETDGTTSDGTTSVELTDTDPSAPSGTSPETTDDSADTTTTGSPGADCDDDADCDDGSACNGEETCDGGTCSEGTPPCENPDADHCAVVCEEGETPQCTVVALDEDRDGDGTIACRQAPGTDCDDADERVSGTAEEVCDGVDNDCNGLADADDGLPLFDQPSIVPNVYFADLAFAPDTQTYGIAYNGPSGDFFTAYDLDQAQVVAPMAFPDTNVDRVFLEWSGETFVGVYERNDFMTRRPINAEGLTGSPLVVFSSGGVGLTYAANELAGGGIAVAWERATGNELAVRILGPDLSPAGNPVFFTHPSPPRAPRVARVGTTHALGQNTGSIDLGFHDADLVEQSSVEITANPTGSIYGAFDVAPMGDGFAVAYGTGVASQRIEYVEYEVDGTLRCGPLQVSAPGPVSFHAMDTFEGVAAIYGAEGNDWVLHRIAEGCTPIGEGHVIETVPFFGEIGDVDINETGIGVVSQIFDDGGANPRMVFRAFGPTLCGGPVPPR